jgi:hypothetical protein
MFHGQHRRIADPIRQVQLCGLGCPSQLGRKVIVHGSAYNTLEPVKNVIEIAGFVCAIQSGKLPWWKWKRRRVVDRCHLACCLTFLERNCHFNITTPSPDSYSDRSKECLGSRHSHELSFHWMSRTEPWERQYMKYLIIYFESCIVSCDKDDHGGDYGFRSCGQSVQGQVL